MFLAAHIWGAQVVHRCDSLTVELLEGCNIAIEKVFLPHRSFPTIREGGYALPP